MTPSGPCPADFMIVGEAPGVEEERAGRPFVGVSGMELDRMLHEAGIIRADCFVTNVCRVRPHQNDISNFVSRAKKCPNPSWSNVDGLWLHPHAAAGLAALHKEIALCRPKVIIALGNFSLWALCSKWKITDWRGSTLRYSLDRQILVLPTYHPAAVLRQWSWRPYVISDLRRAKSLCTEGALWPNYKFVIGPQFPQATSTLLDLLSRLEQGPTHIACDIETRAGHIACIGLAWSTEEAICLPLMCSERLEGYWSEVEEFEIIRLLRRVLTHPNALISGQNFIYDAQYFHRHLGFVPRLALDTMVTHHLCFPGTDKDLSTLSSLYCRHHVYWKDDGKEWAARQDEKLLWEYNCIDAVRTWEIAESLPKSIDSLDLRDQCLFQHTMWWHALETMNLGVRVNLSYKSSLSSDLQKEQSAREAWLNSILEHPINVRSPQQLKTLFYDDFKQKPVINRKTGKPSTDEEALRKIAAREPLLRPIIRRILEIRSLSVFRSTFVESRLDTDGRMRCSYNVAGTETFRFSSSENAFGSGMNLQNVPKGGEMDDGPDSLVLPNIRTLFLPDPGYEMFDMDLSSADLRVVVWEADEPEMKAMLAAGLDPYTEIAKEFYNDPSITKSDPRRQVFKSFAHGTNYMGTARGLAVRLGLPIREAERTQQWYFGRFRRIKGWQDDLRKQLNSRRFVRNAFGYRRYFFDRIEGTVYNQAAAWIPQSTIGLLVNRIWDNIRRHEPGIQILLQVHDSLVGQYPADRGAYYRARLAELSRVPVPYPEPLIIPTGLKTSTKSWGDCR